jgi:mono/diheme cytochrome c family protein
VKKNFFLLFLTGLLFLLAACGSAEAEPSAASANEESSGFLGMGNGMGGGMMARHHATIPDEYAGLSNPIPADDASIERGGEIYATNCATCHGDGGVGDGPAGASLDPAPANIAHTSQQLGDDYFFWRITEGGAEEPFNSTMIAWGSILDEDARWDVINYVQALGDGTVIPEKHMGGETLDPEVEAQKQADMLADAVEQNILTQEEADTFALVHADIDEHMAEMGDHAMGGADEMMTVILSLLVSDGKITQEQSDMFVDAHDRLGSSGLMQ